MSLVAVIVLFRKFCYTVTQCTRLSIYILRFCAHFRFVQHSLIVFSLCRYIQGAVTLQLMVLSIGLNACAQLPPSRPLSIEGDIKEDAAAMALESISGMMSASLICKYSTDTNAK